VSCEIGAQGEDLSPPLSGRSSKRSAAFADHDDVKVDLGGKGRVQIKHDGVLDEDHPTTPCVTDE
jgi:hypothetical protein